jgi:hypothetical protein
MLIYSFDLNSFCIVTQQVQRYECEDSSAEFQAEWQGVIQCGWMNQYERTEPQKVFDFQLDLIMDASVTNEEFGCILSHTLSAIGYFDCDTYYTIADAYEKERERSNEDWTNAEILGWSEEATKNLASGFTRNWCAPHTLDGTTLEGEVEIEIDGEESA